MWLKETTWLSLCLFSPILVTLTSIFLLEMMLKAVIIIAKKPENSRLAYAEVQEDTFTTGKDKNIDENQPGSSRRHSE